MMKKQLTLDEMETRKKINKKILGFGCLPIFLLIIGMFVFDSYKNPPDANVPKVETSDKVIAYIVSQKFVKDAVSFPEEADFPFSYIEAYEYQDNIYKINSEVTGKNAYGVKIKKRYGCQMQYLGGDDMNAANWKLIELTFF